MILHLGAKVRDLPSGSLAIQDPSGMLQWLAKDRAMVVFRDLAGLRSRKAGFEAILRQWVGHV